MIVNTMQRMVCELCYKLIAEMAYANFYPKAINMVRIWLLSLVFEKPSGDRLVAFHIYGGYRIPMGYLKAVLVAFGAWKQQTSYYMWFIVHYEPCGRRPGFLGLGAGDGDEGEVIATRPCPISSTDGARPRLGRL